MPDIFVSYSRTDAERALGLVEALRAAGHSVWIDQFAIDASKSWSNEIVQAIDQCSAFLVLLSEASVRSDNVAREISLAFEAKKSILPIELDAVSLPTEFRYQLAGIQRARFEDREQIFRSLANLGIVATSREHQTSTVDQAAPARKQHGRIGLIVLPFEDLSPNRDNEWFADGLMEELITMLASIKGLRVIDRKTAMEQVGVSFKSIVECLDVQYAIEGSVRKHEQNIKITTQLVDFKHGEQIWSHSFRGTMKDIFDIQEKVAEQVTSGLRLTLSIDEKDKLSQHGTTNSIAYEFFLRGQEEINKNTTTSAEDAIELYSAAIAQDPAFVRALAGKAFALCSLLRSVKRDPAMMQEADQLLERALAQDPNSPFVYNTLGFLRTLQGREEESLTAALEMIRLSPDDCISYFALGFHYSEAGDPARAAEAFEQSLAIDPTRHETWANLVNQYDILNDAANVRFASERALPVVERHLRAHPGEEFAETHRALFLIGANRKEEANAALRALEGRENIGARALYNIACYYVRLNENARALKVLERSLNAGFKNIQLLKVDTDLDPLRGLPDFEALILRVS